MICIISDPWPNDWRGLLAVPLDNRHIKLYDLTGSRVTEC